MRDPVARALSQINHKSRLRPQNVASAEHQLRFLESDKVRQMADYPRVISALKALPDQENVGFFFFEDFVGEMDAFFREPLQLSRGRLPPLPRPRDGEL